MPFYAFYETLLTPIYKKKLNLSNQLAIPAPENNTQIDGPDTPNSSVCDEAGSLNLPETPSPQSTQTPFPTPDTDPETPSVVSSVRKRIRVTAANDIYGRVEGAKRGNNVYGGLLRSTIHDISDLIRPLLQRSFEPGNSVTYVQIRGKLENASTVHCVTL